MQHIKLLLNLIFSDFKQKLGREGKIPKGSNISENLPTGEGGGNILRNFVPLRIPPNFTPTFIDCFIVTNVLQLPIIHLMTTILHYFNWCSRIAKIWTHFSQLMIRMLPLSIAKKERYEMEYA